VAADSGVLNLIIVGTGRAGGSLANASRAPGHRVVGALTRSDRGAAYGPPLIWDEPLPAADLVLVAVRDDAIGAVAERLAGTCGEVGGVAHLSGATSVDALAPIGAECPVGRFHPLQTLPDAVTGGGALAGSWVAITADEPLGSVLRGYAGSLGMKPFPLADELRAPYHAGASAASNFLVETLAVARDLLAAAGVPFDVARPLVEQVVANTFRLGPDAALTGPVARGDIATVRAQQVAAAASGIGDEFALLVAALARRTGQDPAMFR
jgi:predicted short-subunit dehydrogenase-like oxidoreductase (DUF2520 family)